MEALALDSSAFPTEPSVARETRLRASALPFHAPQKYQLLRVLGSGGMGTVLLARDTNLDRLVALKFLRETCGIFLERFRREARLTARLAHPSIVRVFEFDEHEGRPYLAMEYLSGGNFSLARMDPRAVVSKLGDVVDALGHAHAHGIVHRDVKPENLLLDRRGRAYVADFGLALCPGEGRPGRGGVPIAGTPLCMSPEQIRGEPLDATSDIFSFGVTLYRLLTGEWPFNGRTTADVLHAVQHEPAARLRSHAADLPRSLERAVMTCLEKIPTNRFDSMASLGVELARQYTHSSLWSRALERVRAGRTMTRRPTGPRIHPEELS